MGFGRLDASPRAPCVEAARMLASFANWYQYLSAVPLRIVEDHKIMR